MPNHLAGSLIDPYPQYPDPDRYAAQGIRALARILELNAAGQRVQIPNLTGLERAVSGAGAAATEVFDSPGAKALEPLMTGGTTMGPLVRFITRSMSNSGGFLRGLIEEIGIDTGGNVVTFGDPAPGTPTVDITDPRVTPGGEMAAELEADPGLAESRAGRRLAMAGGRGTVALPVGKKITNALGVTDFEDTHISMAGAAEEGLIAEPSGAQEQAADLGGELGGGLVFGVGSFLGARAAISALLKTGKGARMLEPLIRGLAGSERFSRSILGAEAGTPGIETLAAQKLPQLIANIGADLAAGTAGEMIGIAALKEIQGEDFKWLSPEMAFLSALVVGGTAFGIKTTGFQHARDTGRQLSLMARFVKRSPELNIPDGMVVDGKVYSAASQRWRGPNAKGGTSFVKAPEEEQLVSKLADNLLKSGEITDETVRQMDAFSKYVEGREPADLSELDQEIMRLIDADPGGGPLAKALKQHEISKKPVTEAESEDLLAQAAETSAKLGGLGSDFPKEYVTRAKSWGASYVDKAKTLVRNYDDEQLNTMQEELALMFSDESVPETMRIAALGRHMAITAERTGDKRALAVAQTALKVKRTLGDAEIEQLKASYRNDKNPVHREIAELLDNPVLDEFGSNSSKVRSNISQSVQKRLRRSQIHYNRGLQEGSRVSIDGEVAVLQDAPAFGKAAASAEGVVQPRPATIKLDDVIIMPNKGDDVMLVGGRVAEVIDTDDASMTMMVRFRDGSEEELPMNMISVVGQDSYSKTFLTKLAKAETKSASKEAEVPIEPIKRVKKDTGEPVAVKGVTKRKAVIETEVGEEVVDRETLARSSKEPGPQTTPLVFEPGTTPARGHGINFFMVADDAAGIVDQLATVATPRQILETLSDPNFAGKVNFYVSPQPPKDGFTLFAIQVPDAARSPANPSAKRVIGALGGIDVDKIKPRTLKAARVKIDPDKLGDVREHRPGSVSGTSESGGTVARQTQFDLQTQGTLEPIESVGGKLAGREATRLQVKIMRVPKALQEQVSFELKGSSDQRLAQLRANQSLSAPIPPRAQAANATARELGAAAAKAAEEGDTQGARVLSARSLYRSAEAGMETERPTRLRLDEILDEHVKTTRARQSEETLALMDDDVLENDVAILDYLDSDLIPTKKSSREFVEPVALVKSLSSKEAENAGLRMMVKRIYVEGREGGKFAYQLDLYDSTGLVESKVISSTTELFEVPMRFEGELEARVAGGENLIEVMQELNKRPIEGEMIGDLFGGPKNSAAGGAEVRIMEMDKHTATVFDPRTGRTYQLPRTVSELKGMDVEQLDAIATQMNTTRDELLESMGRKRATITHTRPATKPLMTTVKTQRPLDQEEILRATATEIQKFTTEKPYKYSIGAYRRPDGLFATVHPGREGTFIANVSRPERGRSGPLNQLAEPIDFGVFSSRESAEEWLREAHQLRRQLSDNPELWTYEKGAVDVVEHFNSLTDPSALHASDVKEIAEIDDFMTVLMRDQQKRLGQVLPEVRNYAQRFFQRYREMGFGVESLVETRTGRPFTYDVRRNIFATYTTDDSFKQGVGRSGQLRQQLLQPDLSSPVAMYGNTYDDMGQGIAVGLRDSGIHESAVVDAVKRDPGNTEKFVELLNLVERAGKNGEFFTELTTDPQRTLRPDDFLRSRLVKWGPQENRQLGVVIDVEPRLPTVKVMVIEDGNLITKQIHFKNDHLARINSAYEALGFKKSVENLLDGLKDIPAWKEMGSSALDQKIGLAGVTDPSKYTRGFYPALQEALDNVKILSDGTILSSRENAGDLPALVDLVIRAKDLNLDPTKISLENAELLGLKAPKILIPARAMQTLEEMAFDKLYLQMGDNNPFGLLLANARLGRLDKLAVKKMQQQAQRMNISLKPSEQIGLGSERYNTQAYLTEELLRKGAWDPVVADQMFTLRRELPIIRLLMDESGSAPASRVLPEGPVSFRSIGNNPFQRHLVGPFSLPRTIARKHPTFRMFFELLETARVRQDHSMKVGQAWREKFQDQWGGDIEKHRRVRALLEDERLDELLDAPGSMARTDHEEALLWNNMRKEIPDLDNDLLGPFTTMRRKFWELRNDVIEIQLRRGYQGTTLGEVLEREGRPAVQFILRQEFNLGKAQAKAVVDNVEAGKNIYVTNRAGAGGREFHVEGKFRAHPESKKAEVTAFGAFGVQEQNFRSLPREQIMGFIDLLDNFSTYDDIPSAVRASIPDWVTPEEFTFWKNFGIKNFWPMIHQGKMRVVRVGADGTEELLGFAPSGAEALQHLRRLNAEGAFGVDDAIEIRQWGQYLDHVDYQYLGKQGMKRMRSEWRKIASLSGDQTVAYLKAGKIVGGSAPAPLKTAMPRTSNLRALLDNPMQEMAYYENRILTSRYQLDVLEGYEGALSADETLSSAFGTDQMASVTHKNIFREARRLRDLVMGERDAVEKFTDGIVEFMENPLWRSKSFIKKMKDPDYDPFEDPAFIERMYDRDFATARSMRKAASFQAMNRMGFGVSTAFVNATQAPIYTTARLVGLTGRPMMAGKAMTEGIADAAKYWTEVRRLSPLEALTDESTQLAKFASDLGLAVMPQQGMAAFDTGVLGATASKEFFPRDPHTTGAFSYNLGKAADKAHWLSMLMFNKAERANRLVTAFAGRRAAIRMGITDEAEQLVFARKLISETQFDYDDLHLPTIMRNPVMRVIMQFKPFVINAIRFEADMMAGMAMGNRSAQFTSRANAFKQQAAFLTMGSLFGGVMFTQNRPSLAPLKLLEMIDPRVKGLDAILMGSTLDEEGMDNYLTREYKREWSDAAFQMDDLVRFGLAGLFGYNVSERLGVGSAELNPRRWQDLTLGPHYNTVWDAAVAINEYRKITGAGLPTLAGGAAGFAATTAIGARFGLRAPWGHLAGTITGMAAASKMKESATGEPIVPLWQWLNTSKEGRAFVSGALNNVIRASRATVDIMTTGSVFDANGRPLEVPPGVTRTQEVLGRWAGFQTIANTEKREYLNSIRALTNMNNTTRSAVMKAALDLERHGKYGQAVELIAQYNEDDPAGILNPIDSELDLGKMKEDYDRGAIAAALEQLGTEFRRAGITTPAARREFQETQQKIREK